MTHCLLNLFVFIYSPPALRCDVRQATPRAGCDLPESLSAADVRLGKGVSGTEENHFLHSFGQGKEHGEELLVPKLCGTDF